MLTWILALFYFFNSGAIIAQDFFNSSDEFFKSYVSDKGIHYSAIKKDRATLDALTSDIQNMKLEGRSDEFKLAFYLNAYNILVIKSVVENMPLNSPLDVDGFFKTKKHLVSMESITLDKLESINIREGFQDPRIHFGLVCAGLGCPPLTNQAFTPENVNERLDMLTKRALNDPGFIRLEKDNQVVRISKIFEWFSTDFGDNSLEIIKYINKYRNTPIPLDYKQDYYDYDWNLNGY